MLQIACGARHTLVLCAKNELYAAGSNDAQQLAYSREDQERNARKMTPYNACKVRFSDPEVRRKNDLIVAVACGTAHSFALTKSGRVFSWGDNENGQLGLGHFKPMPYPTAVTALATQVRCPCMSIRHAIWKCA